MRYCPETGEEAVIKGTVAGFVTHCSACGTAVDPADPDEHYGSENE